MPLEKSYGRPQSQRLAIRDTLRGSHGIGDDEGASSDSTDRPPSRWLFLTRSAVHLVRPSSKLSTSSHVDDERASMLSTLNWQSGGTRALHSDEPYGLAGEQMHKSALCATTPHHASSRYLPPRLVRDHYPVDKLLLPELAPSSTSKVRRSDAVQAASVLDEVPEVTNAPQLTPEAPRLRGRTAELDQVDYPRRTVPGPKTVNRSAFSKQILRQRASDGQEHSCNDAVGSLRSLRSDLTTGYNDEDAVGDNESRGGGEFYLASSPSGRSEGSGRDGKPSEHVGTGPRVRFKITRPSSPCQGTGAIPQLPATHRPHPPAVKGTSATSSGEMRFSTATSPSAPPLGTPKSRTVNGVGGGGGDATVELSPASPRRSSRANFLDRMSTLKSSLQRIVLEVTGEFEFFRDADQLRALHDVVGSVDDVFLSREYRAMHPMQAAQMDRDFLARAFHTTPTAVAASSSRSTNLSSRCSKPNSPSHRRHQATVHSRVEEAIPQLLLPPPPPLQKSGYTSQDVLQLPARAVPAPPLDESRGEHGQQSHNITGNAALLPRSVPAHATSPASASPATGSVSPLSFTGGRRESAYYHQLVEDRKRNAAATEGENLYAMVEQMETNNTRLLSKLLPGHQEALDELKRLGLL